MEVWKTIQNYPLYEISSDGNIRNIFTLKIPAIIIDRSGYKIVYLKKPGAGKALYLHRLVVTVFVREFERGEVTNHINFIRTDNRLCNLEIVTQKQNALHSKH